MVHAAELRNNLGVGEYACYGFKGDRKTRKPIVEKKRRARINESLQDLRTLLTNNDLQTKMENAEVLELTVKRVESILQSRSQETGTVTQEASERFAAGYIQCMHEVHTFVSTCPGIEARVAAELLNHLLESMPLNENHLHEMIKDLISEPSSSGDSWQSGEAQNPGRHCVSGMSSELPQFLSNPFCDDLCSDLDETETEERSASAEDTLDFSMVTHSKFMWRPW
ncbi:hairy-related 13 [Danio rerio]|uniref:Transcription cofactor HES-6 n=1 Tax=Danio rerio TaxID=7955 RepID=Q568A5_DANRE|nr:hairy-related 13 [Danio rerio]AAH92944.1 Hairy-related 13 [Danio rerio]AAI64322.1 Her13 protein [Danio rerio]|eukprot:NP_001017901.1 hairy-related 13 [Danio rerio]